MALCPACGCKYGLMGANRRALFQPCPECGWSPFGDRTRDEEEALREKEVVRDLEKDGYCYKCKTFRDCHHKRA